MQVANVPLVLGIPVPDKIFDVDPLCLCLTGLYLTGLYQAGLWMTGLCLTGLCLTGLCLTGLCMTYLVSDWRMQVANVPLVLGIPVPDEIVDVNPRRVFHVCWPWLPYICHACSHDCLIWP